MDRNGKNQTDCYNQKFLDEMEDKYRLNWFCFIATFSLQGMLLPVTIRNLGSFSEMLTTDVAHIFISASLTIYQILYVLNCFLHFGTKLKRRERNLFTGFCMFIQSAIALLACISCDKDQIGVLVIPAVLNIFSVGCWSYGNCKFAEELHSEYLERNGDNDPIHKTIDDYRKINMNRAVIVIIALKQAFTAILTMDVLLECIFGTDYKGTHLIFAVMYFLFASIHWVSDVIIRIFELKIFKPTLWRDMKTKCCIINGLVNVITFIISMISLASGQSGLSTLQRVLMASASCTLFVQYVFYFCILIRLYQKRQYDAGNNSQDNSHKDMIQLVNSDGDNVSSNDLSSQI